MTLPSEDDNVQFNILLEAAQALKELEYLRTDATTLQEVFDAVQSKVDATAKKMGVSFMTMEKNFQDVIRMSQQLQKELAEMEALAPGMAGQTLAANPRMAQLASVQSPFSGVAQTTGWTEVNAIQKEVLANQVQELKLADATAKEINSQAAAEQKKVAERQQALALAQKELQAVEQEGLALQNQLKTFGQVSRTSQEMVQYLRAFSQTQQGQGILTKFFGDYNQVKGVTNQIDTIKKAITDLSKATGASFSQSGQVIKENFGSIPGIANQVNQAVRVMGKGFEDAGQNAKSGIDQALTSVNAMRIALGAIVSMLLFQVIQAFSEFFTGAIKQARQLEDTMYRLVNVEKSLSMEGIEITMQGLEAGIDRIQKKMPIFSREDVSQLVGTLAISTKQLHLTEQQILDLAQAVAVLNVRSEKQEDLSTTAQHVLSSLLTGNAKGVTSLGIAFTDNVMRAKAMELGFLKAGEALSTLSENEKGQTKLNIVLESTGQELESVNDYLDSNTGRILQNEASWKDLQTAVGSFFTTLTPLFSPFIQTLIEIVNNLKALVITTKAAAVEIALIWNAFTSTLDPVERIKRVKEAILELPEVMNKVGQQDLRRLFPNLADVPEWLRGLFSEFPEAVDTPTNLEFTTDADAVTDDLDELDQKIEEIAIDAQQAKEDLAILLGQKQEDLDIKFGLKLEDLDTEYLQKAEDAAIDYANKIEDINMDAQQRVADAKQKARDDERKAELEFQLKMKELREEFLMDLEDALHARDARQVLRLQKQYQLDKQKLIDRKNLEDQFRRDSLQQELRDIEADRQRKLQEAERDYQQKLQRLAVEKQRELEEINRWKAREEQELALWYERELAEIDRNTQHKLERLLSGYIEEEKIHEQSQAAIHGILVKWFGQNQALVDNLVSYTASAFANMAAQAAAVMGGMASMIPAGGMVPMGGSPAAVMSAPSTGQSQFGGGTIRGGGRGFAEGGTLLAARPTTVTFGERGPEVAHFSPIGRVGRDEGQVFGSLGDSGQPNGRVTIQLNLSPDLESRIVENTLGQTADIITRINRSKN